MMKLKSWWLKILLIFGFSHCTGQAKCLNSEDVKVRKRIFYIDEQEVTVKIEVSERITHQLVSRIFQILLTEVVGYPNVSLVESNPILLHPDKSRATLRTISNCSAPDKCGRHEKFVPDIMINLETWIEPGFNIQDWIATGEIDDAGQLGPLGRYGWFIPEYTSTELYNLTGAIVENYRTFQNKTLARCFYLEDTLPLSSFTLHKGRNIYCGTKCSEKDGIYRPHHCRGPGLRCATLLAGHLASFELLSYHINKLRLYVNVAWVGDHLKSLVQKLLIDKRRIVFFHDKPSPITDAEKYEIRPKLIPVTFPQCDYEDGSCAYEKYNIFQLQKIAWSKIKSNAPLIFHVLRSMTWTQKMYIELLERHKKGVVRGYDYDTLACNWIKENRMVSDKWIPDGISNKTPLYIGGIFPMSGDYSMQSGVIPAAVLAINAINRNSTLLTQYELQLLRQDGMCEPDKVMRSFIHYVTNSSYKSMVGILGPACTHTVEPVAGVAEHFKTLIISYSAEGALFSDRQKYRYFFRTIPENNLFRNVYLQLFNQLGWRRIAVLTEEGQKYPESIPQLNSYLQYHDIELISKPFSRDKDIRQALKQLQAMNAKIIIGEFYDQAARMVMCEAFRLGMTIKNGYQWFLPRWYSSDWFNTTYYNSVTVSNEQVSCGVEHMMAAIDGYMSLSYKHFADGNEIMQENRTVEAWNDTYVKLVKKSNMKVSRYAGYAYDAVWVYAFALDALLRENNSHNSYLANLHSEKTSSKLVELISGVNFNGVSGPIQFINSSRLSNIRICHWLKKSANRPREIGIYRSFSYESGELDLNESNITWPTQDGQKPKDGTQEGGLCEIEGFRSLINVSCDNSKIILNVIVFMFLCVVTILAVFLLKKRYDRRMKKTEARMKELGLTVTNGILTLDEWEMPRDHIVINRKLGEGAFGTVYGGEALIQDKGWIAVAVKTLKDGAKPEEKLDFLGEAEIMKKFKHVNIVQLIGVCTMGKPVYTIMEFALYGDLKTFLLGRRNLISETTKCEEISNRKLTNMALDVARGLSYLADLKYVHRDLACRNCLVTACRTVKIGDFGMCRAMYDSDYYRFAKRGMLPVRWMAPESLTDGLFTPMSDVWSYGVLLYEIITFGSFPYQGLSNNQVLDYVKKHNTLKVPKGCKIELEELLKRCWSSLPQARPQAAEIVEILASHPDLISPSLGMPMASVEVEDSNSQFDINEHCSPISSMWRHRRHLSAPDTAIINDERPQIVIDEANETAFSATGMKSPFSKSKSARNYDRSEKKKKKEEKVKFKDDPSTNIYHVTYL